MEAAMPMSGESSSKAMIVRMSHHITSDPTRAPTR